VFSPIFIADVSRFSSHTPRPRDVAILRFHYADCRWLAEIAISAFRQITPRFMKSY
jgi:hypothetical protein